MNSSQTGFNSTLQIRVQSRNTCYLCGSTGTTMYNCLADRSYNTPGLWSLKQCENSSCQLVWIDPFPIVDDIPLLYQTYYTHSDAIQSTDVLRLVDDFLTTILADTPRVKQYSILERLLQTILRRITPLQENANGEYLWLSQFSPCKLLDVGCGSGLLLKRLHEIGWDVCGVDPDPGAGHFAKQCSIPVHISSLEALAFQDNSFDVVTLSHVLEHLHDPLTTLSECKRVLRPGGLLVLATPNAQSSGAKAFGRSWMPWEPPRHLYLYSPTSIRVLVNRLGMQIRSCTTPSRMALFVHRTSTQIALHGQLPQMRCPFSPLRWPAALAFRLKEYRQTMHRLVGEELFIVASR